MPQRRFLLMSFLLSVLVAASPALAGPGDTLTFGMHGQPVLLIDDQTGTTYQIGLKAVEFADEATAGDVTMLVRAPRLTACSTHGAAAELDLATGAGNAPLTTIQCGTGSAMAVSIDRCRATIEFHGYVHADHPNVVFQGMTTTDLRFVKSRGNNGGELHVTIFTPKEAIKLHGTAAGPVAMSTCD
jgi:hypothetical protein